jgi:hypothetical protein
MFALPILKDFDVFEDFLLRLRPRLESAVMNQLGLEGMEEAFCWGVIPAVPLRLILQTKSFSFRTF